MTRAISEDQGNDALARALAMGRPHIELWNFLSRSGPNRAGQGSPPHRALAFPVHGFGGYISSPLFPLGSLSQELLRKEDLLWNSWNSWNSRVSIFL